jgi:MFS family permease
VPLTENRFKNIGILLTLILAGEAIFMLPFTIARVFRPTYLQVFDINNFELGTCFSYYGIVAMVSYFFGGPLADKYPARNLMAAALWITSLGGLVMATIPELAALYIVFAFWGFTTIFLFWAALIKSTREWGGYQFQGRAFGFLEGGRGVMAGIVGAILLGVFTLLANNPLNPIAETNHFSFQVIILVTALIVFLVGVLVWGVVPKSSKSIDPEHALPTALEIIHVMKLPGVWMQSLIIICAYVGYKSTDDFSLYSFEVLNFTEVESAAVTTSSMWLRPIFAILAGFLADKYSGTGVIKIAFFAMAGGALLIYSGTFEHEAVVMIVIFAATLTGVFGIRGVYFSIMKEAAIPLVATGTAVGLISVIGYTPDVFMSPLMGYLLDNNPGPLGHRLVFLVLAVFAIFGLLVSFVFDRWSARQVAK